jgi:hypothetical protein
MADEVYAPDIYEPGIYDEATAPAVMDTLLMSPREFIEADLLTTMQGVTIANGYAIPHDFKLITREILDFPETENRRPALILGYVESQTEPLELGGIVQLTLNGLVSVHLDPERGVLPATLVNSYKTAIRRALVTDRSRGGWAITTWVGSEATPAIWIKTTPLIADLEFRVESIPFLDEEIPV